MQREIIFIWTKVLAVIFGVENFHQYCFGHHFALQTYHKPLLRTLGEDKQISNMTAAGLQRWSLILTGCDYTLKYRNGTENGNADALRRLLVEDQPGGKLPSWSQ